MPAEHGTRGRYYSKTDPCRCPACTEANRIYQRAYYHDPKRRAAVRKYEEQEHVRQRRREAVRAYRAQVRAGERPRPPSWGGEP